MTNIKLYRGLKTDSLTIVDQDMASRHAVLWHKILTHRQGSTKYPTDLDNSIAKLHEETRLYRQVFSDCRATAERYLNDSDDGVIVELEVPISELIRHFELEIQNYSKRKQHFEIVYTVRSAVLADHMQSWCCKILSLKSSPVADQ